MKYLIFFIPFIALASTNKHLEVVKSIDINCHQRIIIIHSGFWTGDEIVKEVKKQCKVLGYNDEFLIYERRK